LLEKTAAELFNHLRAFARNFEQKKKAAPEGAAKFREETPRKGHGVAERKSAIPRCSNMAPNSPASKH